MQRLTPPNIPIPSTKTLTTPPTTTALAPSTLKRPDEKSPSWIVKEITLLFKALAFPDKQNADAYFGFFEEALAKLPAEHVRTVLTAYRVGDLGDGRFVPKAAEVRQAVQKRMELERIRQAEDRNIREMLEARRARENRGPCGEAEYDRVRELVAAFKAGNASAPDHKGNRVPTADEAREWLEAHEGGAGLAPVTQFSPKLLAQLKGELPIGEGKMGCASLMTEEQRRAYDDARFAEIDKDVREMVG